MKTKFAAASPRLYPAFSMKESLSFDTQHHRVKVFIPGRRPDHDRELSRLDDVVHVDVVECQRVGGDGHFDRDRFTHGESYLDEPLQLFYGAGHGTHEI